MQSRRVRITFMMRRFNSTAREFGECVKRFPEDDARMLVASAGRRMDPELRHQLTSWLDREAQLRGWDWAIFHDAEYVTPD